MLSVILGLVSVLLAAHAAAAEPCDTQECGALARDIKKHMDTNVDPCSDPYHFACGSWLESFELPADQSSWTLSFSQIANDTRNALQELIEEADGATKCTFDKEVTGDEQWTQLMHCYHQSCMDEATLDRKGMTPLLNFMEREVPFFLSLPAFEQYRTARDLNPPAMAKDFDTEKGRGDLAEQLARLHARGVSAFVTVGPSMNPLAETKKQQMYLWQDGLGLSYSQYDDDAAEKPYLEHITNLFDLIDKHIADPSEIQVMTASRKQEHNALRRRAQADDSDSSSENRKRAEKVLSLEKELHKITLGPEMLRDPIATTNQRSLKQIQDKMPHFDWAKYFGSYEEMGYLPEGAMKMGSTVVVHNVEYFANVDKLMAEADRDTMNDYFLLRTMRAWSDYLSKDFREEFYSFEKKLYDVDPKPRWKQCVDATKSTVGWVLAREFVLKKSTPNSKQIAEEMLSSVREAFRDDLNELSWMDDETKEGALEKERIMNQKIDYPDWLLDEDEAKGYTSYFRRFYGDLPLKPSEDKKDTFTDLFKLSEYLNHASTLYGMSDLGKEPDETIWGMPPTTVNAYYSRSLNEMVFLGGILRTPFMRGFADDIDASHKLALEALNYGAVGAVMGHELTHAFDDAGAQFDGEGRLSRWWTNKSESAFQTATSCMVQQYGSFETPEVAGLMLNGNLTLGENIADNGGFQLAKRALKKKLGADFSSVKPLADMDMTVEQLFYVSWAQTWCSVYTPATLKRRVGTDPHSPGMFRALGVLQNSQDFSEAFVCRENDPINTPPAALQHRCRVW
ncbi:unnamed protein product [Vitrella brassicaformis CCMP3155]|uniref:Peptidase M13 N-terminal domain-containing protein n=2 Tax=Vitrella brassicaformis TaxID=1169539 RepID=A0A0G4ET35_VITBC|nr:unnamed protein product [Vitrella brassicaformis CCMP3155]|mmetsp:Transcript_49395/g.123882  ORF Transcript_49395/g.123882 Transcript_49395/m.123882 type:complete len:793 (+) Transcript_49395:142-2520(+)|eukprot:CEM01325.1 unnamed protein product [Vitrella brassicaformis CCMP3155]